MNDGLSLLGKKCDHFPLRSYRPLQPTVRPIEKPHDGCLLIDWRRQDRHAQELLWIQPKPGAVHAGRSPLVFGRIQGCPQQMVRVCRKHVGAPQRSVNPVRRADDPRITRYPSAPIQAHSVLMTTSSGRQTLWPTFDSARNIVTVFSLRGVTPVRWDTESSSLLAQVDRSSTSRKRYFARVRPQPAGVAPSQGTPESLYSAYGFKPAITPASPCACA